MHKPRSESLVNWPMRRDLENGCLTRNINKHRLQTLRPVYLVYDNTTRYQKGVRSVHLIQKAARKRADARRTSKLRHSVRKLFCFSSWRNPPRKVGNTQQMFLCHQNVMCPMDVLAITGKSSNASSRITELRAGLIRNVMSFKALYFWQLSEKTRWTYLMDSSSSKKLTCKTRGKSWKSLCRWNTWSAWIVQVSSPTSRTARSNRSVHLLSASTGKEL